MLFFIRDVDRILNLYIASLLSACFFFLIYFTLCVCRFYECITKGAPPVNALVSFAHLHNVFTVISIGKTLPQLLINNLFQIAFLHSQRSVKFSLWRNNFDKHSMSLHCSKFDKWIINITQCYYFICICFFFCETVSSDQCEIYRCIWCDVELHPLLVHSQVRANVFSCSPQQQNYSRKIRNTKYFFLPSLCVVLCQFTQLVFSKFFR